MSDSFKFDWHRAYGASDVTVAARSVGYLMWDHAEQDGTGARPGIELLAQKSGLSERQVRRHLADNVRRGWLRQLSSGSNSGRKALASVYALAIPAKRSVDTPDAKTAEGSADIAGSTDIEVHDHRSRMAVSPVTNVSITGHQSPPNKPLPNPEQIQNNPQASQVSGGSSGEAKERFDRNAQRLRVDRGRKGPRPSDVLPPVPEWVTLDLWELAAQKRVNDRALLALARECEVEARSSKVGLLRAKLQRAVAVPGARPKIGHWEEV